MAISKQVFNTATGKRSTVSAEIEVAYIQSTNAPAQDFYIKLTCSGVDKAGSAIGPFFLTALTDLPDTNRTQQHPAGSGSPYTTLTAQISNYIRHIMEGDGGNTALDF